MEAMEPCNREEVCRLSYRWCQWRCDKSGERRPSVSVPSTFDTHSLTNVRRDSISSESTNGTPRRSAFVTTFRSVRLWNISYRLSARGGHSNKENAHAS